jgi:hypothetical protein
VPTELAPGKEIFLFFKKILCRVPSELAPDKGFFAGGQVWHPANYKFFLMFLALFFLEPWYSNYNSISKFGIFFTFYTIFL